MDYLISRTKFFVAIAIVGFALAACTSSGLSNLPTAKNGAAELLTRQLVVFRSPTCGCCEKWIDRAKAAGFDVEDKVTEEMSAVKQAQGIPQTLNACHTTIAGNYVIEGHVPIEDVERLLAEQPEVAGIAVPGMPTGSPGMEAGDYVEPYTVFSFTKTGETASFAEHS